MERKERKSYVTSPKQTSSSTFTLLEHVFSNPNRVATIRNKTNPFLCIDFYGSISNFPLTLIADNIKEHTSVRDG